MELKKIEINDDFPLMISLCGKSIWKKDENNKVAVDCLLDRQEDNYTMTTISCTELKPSVDKNKLIDILKYFFSVCDEHMSPQCLWGTNNCNYSSLLKNYEAGKNKPFDDIFAELTKQFPELKQPENFLEKVPKGKTLLDVVSSIEIAYPRTWTVDYIKERKLSITHG